MNNDIINSTTSIRYSSTTSNCSTATSSPASSQTRSHCCCYTGGKTKYGFTKTKCKFEKDKNQNTFFFFKNKPKRTPSERIQVTDTFKAELQRRVGNEANSREFVLPTKIQSKIRLADGSIT